MTTTTAVDLRAGALALAARGWRVFPLAPGTKDRPLVKAWPQTATTDPAQIEAWWRETPTANIGLATGPGSGLFVLDVDPRHGGDDALRDLEARHGQLPETPEVLTPGGGRHLYFKCPAGLDLRNSAGLLGPGLDIRGAGGYVVAPPSVRPDGSYVWECEHGPDDAPLADAPAWLLARLTERKPHGAGTGTGDGEPIAEGRRNATLTRIAGAMRRVAATTDEILAALRAVNQGRCRPPLPDEEVRTIARSVASRYAPVPSPDTAPPFPTEILPGPVRRFVEACAAAFPCPPDFLAIPTMVLLGAAIGRSLVVRIKAGWEETARLWWGYVAEPGEIKSPALARADYWVRHRQARDSQDYRQKLEEYEEAVARWQRRAKGDDSPKPTAPQLRHSLVSDVTIEALGKILLDTPRGVPLIADELSGFFLGIGQYKKAGGSDRKHYLSIWSGKGLKVDRLTRGSLYVPAPFLAVTGGIQPGVLKDLDPEAGARDGLIHRLLLVEPLRVPAPYNDREIPPEVLEPMGALYDALYALKPAQESPETGSYWPQVLTMTAEAKDSWIQWHDAHVAEAASSDFPPFLRGPWAKLRGYSASLSLILALAETPAATAVPIKAVTGAVTLIEEYLKPHLRRLYPRMLARGRTDFDKCRAAIVAALRERPRTYKDLRQTIGGRFDGDLVRRGLTDLDDSGEISQRPKKGARAGVTEWFIQEVGDL
jgi:hypothetical protein